MEPKATWTVRGQNGGIAPETGTVEDYMAMLEAVTLRWPYAAGQFHGVDYSKIPALAAELYAWLQQGHLKIGENE